MSCCLVTLNLEANSYVRFLLGIGIGAEYPCGSVSASEQSEEQHINKKAQHRWFALATSKSNSNRTFVPIIDIDLLLEDTMIDWGFVVASLVPLILFLM